MLIGSHIQKVDAKGRTAIPSKFKKELGITVLISRWYEGAVSIFAPESWRRIVEQATLGSSVSASARDTERFLLGGAFEATLDAKGRFVIPQILRDFGKIQNEVVFVGLGNRIEVWAKSAWIERELHISKNAEKLLERAQGVYREN
ncbi:MAG: hypothetical protein AAB599_03285 [Patescibacteria group bacterium]